MKKQLVLGMGLAVLATPAFASKARLQALGESTFGSYYINDNRNIFLNAAQVNNHKDLVTFEWGNSSDTAAQDNNAAPKAEGGVFFGNGNMVYGVQLGSESNSSSAFRAWSGINTAYAAENNVLDLFVGGDAGIKWGANLTYSKSAENELAADAKQEAMRTRLGVDAGNWQGFANINLSNKAEQADGAQEFKGKTGLQVGGSYDLNEYRLFAEYQTIAGSDEVADEEASVKTMLLGAARTNKLNDKANLFTKLQFSQTTCVNEGGNNLVIANDASNADLTCIAAAGSEDETKVMSVPLTIGLEYDAASWIVLRGSVSQSIMGTVEIHGNKRSQDNTTRVNAGATLKFGDLNVDGVIGTDTTGDGTPNGNSTAASGGTLRTDALMSRVSMTYKF
jgi:hypothetical protein